MLDRKEVSVVEAMGLPCNEVGSERIVVGENGKIWMQGRIANSFVVSGQSTCVELFVKNHSAKKVSGPTTSDIMPDLDLFSRIVWD